MLNSALVYITRYYSLHYDDLAYFCISTSDELFVILVFLFFDPSTIIIDLVKMMDR